MKTNRRHFISTAVAGSIGTALPLSAYGSNLNRSGDKKAMQTLSILDEILKKPVFKKETFPIPVIIETLELMRYKNSFLCRVRSKDGAEGISVGHSGQLR